MAHSSQSSAKKEVVPVTERKRLEEELYRQQKAFQMLAENALDMIVRFDRKHTILYVNKAVERLTGRPVEYYVGKSLTETSASENLTRWQESLTQVFEKAQPMNMEFVVQVADGQTRYYQSFLSPELDPRGRVASVLSVARDITELKLREEEKTRQLEAEQAARETSDTERKRLYTLFMQAPALICMLRGPEHVFEFANAAYLRLLHNRAILGKTALEALPEFASQGFIQLLDRVYTSGEPFIGQEVKSVVRNDEDGTSETFYFNFVYQPTRDDDGKVDGILVHAIEVTEQIKGRERLRESQERLEIAQHVGKIGTFEWHIPSNDIMWTPNLEALYGLPAGGFEGKYENWARRVHSDDLAEAEKNLQTAAAGGPAYNIEFRVVLPSGDTRWMLAKGEVVDYDEQGKPVRMIGVNIDITERKETERQLSTLNQSLLDLAANLEAKVEQRTEILQQLNTELERSNQELQEFAYVASHDLQEPLRKIQAFGNLLEEEYGPVLEDGKSYLDRMRNAAARMRVLIDDLLTFSRVTTKALPFSKVDLNNVVEGVLSDLETQIQNTHGTVKVEPLPVIDADAFQMRQVFQNLIGNALKFHKRDQAPVVTVSTEEVTLSTGLDDPEVPPQRAYRLFVMDNGIGFEERYLDRIFTVFQRLHGRGEFEGTGIGLAVVRKIVERHGGSITAQSQVGQGSTFIVTLPVQSKPQEEQRDGE